METSHETLTKTMVKNNEGPYTWISKDEKRVFENGRTFRFLLYGAYNAYGLIGSESNGIVVLDEDNMQVLCDEIGIEDSGYFGPSARQVKMLYGLTTAFNWDQFRDFINAHKRSRYSI